MLDYITFVAILAAVEMLNAAVSYAAPVVTAVAAGSITAVLAHRVYCFRNDRVLARNIER